MFYLSIIFLAITAMVLVTLLSVHIGFRAPRRVERNSPADYGLAYEEITIPTAVDKLLFAWWLPAASTAPTLILLHGWGGNAGLMLPLALPLRQAGLNILLLDARNHGRSDADSFSSLPRFAEDAGAAVEWVKARKGGADTPIALLGHSVGAGAVLFEASRRNDIAAVISVAAFAHPKRMMSRYLNRFRIPAFYQVLILRYIEWVIGYACKDIAPMNTACRVKCPVLLVHGSIDKTVPVADAHLIKRHCRSKELDLYVIDGCGHDPVEAIERHAGTLLAFLKAAGVEVVPEC